jgi:hypothetical protein
MSAIPALSLPNPRIITKSTSTIPSFQASFSTRRTTKSEPKTTTHFRPFESDRQYDAEVAFNRIVAEAATRNHATQDDTNGYETASGPPFRTVEQFTDWSEKLKAKSAEASNGKQVAAGPIRFVATGLGKRERARRLQWFKKVRDVEAEEERLNRYIIETLRDFKNRHPGAGANIKIPKTGRWL